MVGFTKWRESFVCVSVCEVKVVQSLFPSRCTFNMLIGPPFAAITASILLGRLSTRCWNIAAETCFHSTHKNMRSDTVVWRLGLAHSRHSISSQMCSMGLRSGLYAGQSSSSTPISTILSILSC